MKRALIAATLGMSAILLASVPNLAVARTIAPQASLSVARQAANQTNCGNSGQPVCVVSPANVTFGCGGFTVSGTHDENTSVTCSTSGTNVSESAAHCSGQTIVINGTDLDLVVPGAEVFQINTSTNQATQVSAITGSGGEFVICSISGVTLPPTGGAAH